MRLRRSTWLRLLWTSLLVLALLLPGAILAQETVTVRLDIVEQREAYLFTIGAFAFIFNEQGRILLCHRRDLNVWNLPGGGVESGELPTEAVVREVREDRANP